MSYPLGEGAGMCVSVLSVHIRYVGRSLAETPTDLLTYRLLEQS